MKTCLRRVFLEDEYTRYAAEIGNGASDNIKAAIIKYGRYLQKTKKLLTMHLRFSLNLLMKIDYSFDLLRRYSARV